MSDELKWRWKMGYCKGRGISPAQEWAWAEAEQAYLAKMEEAPQDTMEQNGHKRLASGADVARHFAATI